MEGVEHALCNAHHLRELKALSDMRKSPGRGRLFRFLRHACQAVNLARRRNEHLKPAFRCLVCPSAMTAFLRKGTAFHESQPPLETLARKRRGRTRRRHRA